MNAKTTWTAVQWPESSTDAGKFGFPASRSVSCHVPLRGSEFECGYVALRLQFHKATAVGNDATYSVEACLYNVYSSNPREWEVLGKLLKQVDAAVKKAYKAVTGYQGGGFMQIPAGVLYTFLLAFYSALKVRQVVGYRPFKDDLLDELHPMFVSQLEDAIRDHCEFTDTFSLKAA